MDNAPDLISLDNALAVYGLMIHGLLELPSGDALLPIKGRSLGTIKSASSLVLIGHAGSTFWPHFQAWFHAPLVPSAHGSRWIGDRLSDPLDAWSKQIIGGVAKAHDGEAIFPSDQPYQPFQQWAMAATGVKPSPLGILIHPAYGLWHAYRGAIVFGAVTLSQKSHVLNQEADNLSHPCDNCSDKPCLSACPVNAFSDGGYDVESCRAHVKSEAGMACRTGGCLARRACPVGRAYQYVPKQMKFHMNAFI